MVCYYAHGGDVTGKELDPQKVVEARSGEVHRSKAKAAGAKVISVCWVDINKGDIECPNYCS